MQIFLSATTCNKRLQIDILVIIKLSKICDISSAFSRASSHPLFCFSIDEILIPSLCLCDSSIASCSLSSSPLLGTSDFIFCTAIENYKLMLMGTSSYYLFPDFQQLLEYSSSCQKCHWMKKLSLEKKLK